MCRSPGQRLRSIAWLIGLWVLLGPASAVAEPLKVKIQVIRASKVGKTFNPKLDALKKGMSGYTGAELTDDLEAKLEAEGSVQIDILNRSQKLVVRLLDLDRKQGVVTLSLSIDAFGLKDSKIKYQKGKTEPTLMVGKPINKDEAVFVAVTPQL